MVSITLHYGLKKPLTQIFELARTDKKGIDIIGLIKLINSLGFNAK
ncbi:MAG: hypothetical protein JXA99_06785 [Candidatus Lokiarchaeota archaeon]|nr:hypothetical protein [Candidatus Lokiarchaeota archaeon]